MQTAGIEDPLVLGLPRGGVPVAYETARVLGAALDILLVRKLGAPSQPELAIGAIGEDGARVINNGALLELRIDDDVLADIEKRERERLREQTLALRVRKPIEISARNVILIDDGLATGATMIAAVQTVRAKSPASVTVAVPVAPPDSLVIVERYADRVYALATLEPFGSVGAWYGDFRQVSDEDVRNMLA